LVVKAEVEQSVNSMLSNLQRWRQLGGGMSSVAREEKTWTEGELKSTLSNIDQDVEELEETIRVVGNNPGRFNIAQDELSNRKYFIQQTKNTCRTVRDELSNPTRPEPSLQPGAGIDRYARGQASINKNNDNFIESSMQQQSQIMEQQDSQLNLVGQSIGRLKQMGTLIGEEVDDQNVLLDDFYTDMEATEHKMSNVQKKMEKILTMVDGKKQNVIIGILLVVMVIVVVLFFST